MATFSQQFLANLGRPQLTKGMMDLGATIGGLPGKAEAQQKRQQLAEIMQRGNAALAAGDATNIGRVRRELEAAGFAKEAAQMAQAEAQARKQQAASGMLMSAVADPTKPLSPEVIQERLGEGLTAQGLSSALQVREALKPSPFFTRAEQIDLLEKGFLPVKVAEASQKRDISLLGQLPSDSKFNSTITEWVDPKDPAAGVKLKTIQNDEGSTFLLGSKRQVTEEDLRGLQKRERTGVSVSLGGERESALAKSVGEDVAEEVSIQVQKAGDAMDLRSTLAEAKLIAQDQPEIFGALANQTSGARKATLTLMRAMGVSSNDPLMSDFANKEASVDQIRSFTQDFVKTRLAATKGAISDKEFDTFIASVPNLLQEQGGYLKLLNQMESMNERAIMKGMALREARVAENPTAAINKIERSWDKFSSDFRYSTFMPPEEQRKLWNLYLEKDGKVNRGDDVVFILSAGNQQGSLTYNDLARRAAKNQQSTAQYIYDLYYGDTGTTISLDLSGFDF